MNGDEHEAKNRYSRIWRRWAQKHSTHAVFFLVGVVITASVTWGVNFILNSPRPRADVISVSLNEKRTREFSVASLAGISEYFPDEIESEIDRKYLDQTAPIIELLRRFQESGATQGLPSPEMLSGMQDAMRLRKATMELRTPVVQEAIDEAEGGIASIRNAVTDLRRVLNAGYNDEEERKEALRDEFQRYNSDPVLTLYLPISPTAEAEIMPWSPNGGPDSLQTWEMAVQTSIEGLRAAEEVIQNSVESLRNELDRGPEVVDRAAEVEVIIQNDGNRPVNVAPICKLNVPSAGGNLFLMNGNGVSRITVLPHSHKAVTFEYLNNPRNKDQWPRVLKSYEEEEGAAKLTFVTSKGDIFRKSFPFYSKGVYTSVVINTLSSQ